MKIWKRLERIKSADLNANFTSIADGTGINDGVIESDCVSNEEWVAPTLVNSWTNYGSDHPPAGYMKDIFGVVHLRGLIKNGSSASAVMFTLPVGYRPVVTGNQNYALFPAINPNYSSNLGCRINIYDGEVSQSSTNGSTLWVSLSGISFKAE